MSTSEHHHFLLRVRPGMQYLSGLCLGDLSEIPQQNLDLPFLNPTIPVAASSCGCFLYFDDWWGNVFLCNPTTKQFRPFLVESSIGSGGSLGYDSKSDDCKIVWVGQSGAKVYSLKQDDGWKDIPMPPTRKRLSLWKHQNVYVARTGCSYWVARDSGSPSEILLSFNFSSETLSVFPLPAPPQKWINVEYLLVKLHDGLGVVRYWKHYGNIVQTPPYIYELWVWKEREMEWDRMFDVCVCW